MPKSTSYATSASLCAMLCFSASHAGAAEERADALAKSKKPASEFTLDLNAPTAPGFVVIGAMPKNVADPGDLKQFSVHTGSFFSDGKLKPGLAVSGLPYWWSIREITHEQYANSDADGRPVEGGLEDFERILARTQFSLATVEFKDAQGKDGVKLGAGFQTQMLDRQDIRLNVKNYDCVTGSWDRVERRFAALIKTVSEGAQKAVDDDGTLDFNEEFKRQLKEAQTKVVADYDNDYEKCKKQAEKRFLQEPSWTIGAGVAARSRNGDVDDLTFNGASVWSTYRAPFGGNLAAIVYAKADIHTDFKVASGALVTGDAFEAAFAFALEEPTWKLDATASYHFRDFQNSAFDDDYFQFSATAAFKVRDGVWLEASAGTKTDAKFGQDGFGLIQLKMDLSTPVMDATKP